MPSLDHASSHAEARYRVEARSLKAPAVPARRGFLDECFHTPAKFSLGFMKPSETFRFGVPSAFGAPGAGGAMGYTDPETGIGYGYVTNRMAPRSRVIRARSRCGRRSERVRQAGALATFAPEQRDPFGLAPPATGNRRGRAQLTTVWAGSAGRGARRCASQASASGAP